jgi:hypothetical protein
MVKIPEYIFHDIASSIGGHGGTKIYCAVDVKKNSAQIVVEHTITERMPIDKYEEAMHRYERLTGGNGRRVWTLQDLTK